MSTIELHAETRTVFGKKVKDLRQAGIVPAEIYGKKTKNLSIQIPTRDLEYTLSAAGNTNLISIKIGSKKKGIPVLARNIQYSPVRQRLLHVDFYAVIMDETVSVNVPIRIIGESDLIAQQNGTLMTGLNELEIEALPADIPESIEIDISELAEFGQSIHVSDLPATANIIIHSSPESLLASIQPPRTSDEELTVEGADVVEEGEEEGVEESTVDVEEE